MDTLASEQSKYESIWGIPAYALRSPGLRHLDKMLKMVKPEDAATITDWGSGSGQAADRLHELGYKVSMVDIAANSYKGKYALPLAVASLWDMPESIKATEYGICCDVMEHIPPEFVDATLAEIAKRTQKKVFFQIALFHDNTYTQAGPLHLSVFPIAWWVEKLGNHFSRVEAEGLEKAHLFAVCEP